MKLLILATGKTEDFEDGYGARLVEQSRAVPAPPAADEETDCRVADAPRKGREKSAKKG